MTDKDAPDLPVKPSRINPRDLKPDRELRIKHRVPKSNPYCRSVMKRLAALKKHDEVVEDDDQL